MNEQPTGHHDNVTAANAHNAELAREILAKKRAQDQKHHGEPPLTDDIHHVAEPNPSVQEPIGNRGSTGGERNMGGGRS
jgi:hypothetical protein